ncbi:MAG TPA: Type 1 glutamine amidotransferase-like domain-containing protein [Candidatus Saccharimonadales bacterium]|nr:Type 1 glutamine amidotransferase-like domain-containing protein [Candidatus Saccharimonadales bacterium]
MKLYLSSVGIPNPAAFRELFSPSQTHQIAFITNGWDNATTGKSTPFIESTRQTIISEGFACELLDLTAYKQRPNQLQEELQRFAGVWVTGGNAFYLNYLMNDCNFGEIVQELGKNNFVYGGESAGAVVAGSTLHGIEVLDSLREAPHALWNGLGLVPYGIIPHWGETKYELYLERVYREMEQFAEVRTLANGDYIVASDA